MRTTKSVTISLPPAQLKIAERLAKKQNRTMSELFREALRRLEQDEWQRPFPATLQSFAQAVALFREDARRAGLNKTTKNEINAEVEAVRKARGTKAEKTGNRSGK